MKNLKKFLAVIITVAMLATMMIPAFAEEEISADAKTCANLGLLAGDGAGVTAEYLAKGTERIQAAIIMLRLLGKIDEAVEFDYTENFDDADKVWQGGKNIMGYLKANPEYGWVGDAGNFKPTDKASAKEIYKVILNVLGYETGEGKDFAWNDTIDFAAEKGLKAIGDLESLTNDDVAAAIVEGLKANLKTGNMTLVEDLVAKKIVSEKVAQDEGLIAKELKATVAATGAKELTVSFNQAVDTAKVAFSIKKGSISANIKEVKFAEDKKSAVIEMASNLTEGTYTVTVKGLEKELTASVDVKDEEVKKIEFTSDVAPLVRDSEAKKITVGYKVLNQYGEDISNSEAVTVTAGKGAPASNPVSGGTVTLEYDAAPYTISEKINVTIVHASSGAFASAVLSVGTEARVADIAMTSIYNPDDKELVAGETANFYIVVEAKDQYGNKMEDIDLVKDDVMLTVSNPNVADIVRGSSDTIPAIEVEGDNKVTLVVKGISGDDKDEYTAGTSVVSLISKTTGKRATFDIVVSEAVKVDVFTMTAPSVFAAGDKKVEIPFTAIDQFGEAVTKNLEGKITFTKPDGITVKFVKNYVTGNDKLEVSDDRTSPSEGTVVISALTGTQKYVTLTLNVKKAATPSVVAGIKDFDKVYAKGATATMEDENIIINDQYGREVDLADYAGYNVAVKSSAPGKVEVTGDEIIIDVLNANNSVFTGVAKGSSTITLSLYNNKNEEVKNSAYTFAAKTVEKADIDSYELEDLGKTFEDTDKDESGKYEVTVKVNGIMADGSKVVVPASYYSVIINDDFVGYDSVANSVYSSPRGSEWGDDSSKDIPVIVSVDGEKGPVILSKNITVSKDAPAITTLELVTNGIATKEEDGVISVSVTKFSTVTALVIDAVKAVDQYGKEISEIAADYTYVKATNIPADRKADLSDIKAGDTFNVSAITKTGKSITFKVVVND